MGLLFISFTTALSLQGQLIIENNLTKGESSRNKRLLLLPQWCQLDWIKTLSFKIILPYFYLDDLSAACRFVVCANERVKHYGMVEIIIVVAIIPFPHSLNFQKNSLKPWSQKI